MDLSKGLREAFKKLSQKAIVDEDALKEFIKQIQIALISADVPVKLVFELTKKIQQQAQQSTGAIPLREQILKFTYLELCNLLGSEVYSPSLKPKKILLLGLYGSGKTTSAAKLAYFYKNKGLSVGLICADVDRPAAYDQLEQLAKQINVNFYGEKNQKDISKILEQALAQAKEEVLILDSAGRSAFDEELVSQIQQINQIFKPDEKILVLAADIGQIASAQAKKFDQAIKLSGIFISKLDGSGKGGGALAACQEAKIPVMFIGKGEKIQDIETFDSKKFVGNLLGLPNFEVLIEKLKETKIEEDLSPEDFEEFNFEVFYKQLLAAKKLGPLSNILSMLGFADLPPDMVKLSEEKLKKYQAIISSMTKKERKNPKLLKEASRIERIARGSGLEKSQVQELLNHFNKMEKTISSIQKNKGLRKKLQNLLSKKGSDLSNLDL